MSSFSVPGCVALSCSRVALKPDTKQQAEGQFVNKGNQNGKQEKMDTIIEYTEVVYTKVKATKL